MLRLKSLLPFLAVAMVVSALPSSADAGPLLDWLRCRRAQRQQARALRAANPCNTCSPCATNTSFTNTSFRQAAPNTAGLQPGQCMTTCNKVCSRTVVNYVPCTAYRTAWCRVPVTQYRPVTNTDPCTGCTVTCMKPCTTYSWQMKREPYTTYRPVYRQEQYTVPVTTISNDCATGTCPTGDCGPCNTGTCATGTCPTTAQAVLPGTNTNLQGSYYTYPQGSVTAPSSTLDPNGGYLSSPTPADQIPELNVNPQNSQKPILEKLDDADDSSAYMRNNQPRRVSSPSQQNSWIDSTPRYIPTDGKTARSPVTKRWSYAPVRFASHTSAKSVNVTPNRRSSAEQPVRIQGSFQPAKRTGNDASQGHKNRNSGWKTVEW